MKIIRVLCAALLSATPTLASAQVFPPGTLVLAGMPVGCGAIPTQFVFIPNDMAKAIPGWILLNPELLKMPPVLQLFIYAHECGHHVVGLNEAQADCWAIATGKQQGWFKQQDIYWLIESFKNNPGDWTHKPGPYRLNDMINCYNAS